MNKKSYALFVKSNYDSKCVPTYDFMKMSPYFSNMQDINLTVFINKDDPMKDVFASFADKENADIYLFGGDSNDIDEIERRLDFISAYDICDIFFYEDIETKNNNSSQNYKREMHIRNMFFTDIISK